jgi:hypothetical protein
LSVCFLCSKHCCSWRGSNPRPWAHKTHALTTRPQERRWSGVEGGWQRLLKLLNAGTSLGTARRYRCLAFADAAKTVLYTGSVFEYIRAWRFQPLAQGQSRMMTVAPTSVACMSTAMIVLRTLAGCVLLPDPSKSQRAPSACTAQCKATEHLAQ